MNWPVQAGKVRRIAEGAWRPTCFGTAHCWCCKSHTGALKRGDLKTCSAAVTMVLIQSKYFVWLPNNHVSMETGDTLHILAGSPFNTGLFGVDRLFLDEGASTPPEQRSRLASLFLNLRLYYNQCLSQAFQGDCSFWQGLRSGAGHGSDDRLISRYISPLEKVDTIAMTKNKNHFCTQIFPKLMLKTSVFQDFGSNFGGSRRIKVEQ